MTPRSRQHGFTLVELMLATVCGLLILGAAFGILYQSIDFVELMRSRVFLNAAARESFHLLLDGANVGGEDVPGLRGFAVSAEPSPASLRTGPNGFRIQLTSVNAAGDPQTVQGALIAEIDITCTGLNEPHPACNGTEILPVDGYVGGNPSLYGGGGGEKRSVVEDRTDELLPARLRTRELEVILIDAYRLRRDEDLPGETAEVYRTIFTYNRD